MTDSQILGELFNVNALVPLQDKYGKKYVELSEPQAPDSQVTINNIPKDALVIKTDAFVAPDGIFQGSKGECKRSDYLIISEEKKCAIHIEVKRTTANLQSVKKQLRGSQCFLRYCQEIGVAFWQDSEFLKDYENRFVYMSHTNINKRTTQRPKRETVHSAGKHNSPQNALRVSFTPSIQFNQIASLG